MVRREGECVCSEVVVCKGRGREGGREEVRERREACAGRRGRRGKGKVVG